MEAGAVHFKSLSGKTYILLLGYQSEKPSQSDLVLPLSGMQTNQKRQKKESAVEDTDVNSPWCHFWSHLFILKPINEILLYLQATGAVSVMCGSYSLKQNSFRTTWPPNQRPIVGIHNGISIVQPTQKESAYLSQDTHMNTAENKNLALNYSHITWQPRILAVLAPPRR